MIKKTELTSERKGIMISAIMDLAKDSVVKKNKELIADRRFSEQKSFDAGKMFFDLAFMDDDEFLKLADKTLS